MGRGGATREHGIKQTSTSRRDIDRAPVSPARPDGLEDLFALGGDMGALMAARDWAATPLGDFAKWPQSLRTAVSICLVSRFPILIWWGPDLVMLYNDAYSEIIASKHPGALGAPGRNIFPEIWDIIGPMLEGVQSSGKATWSDDQLLLLERNGYPEECYFTFSYSPIFDESGGVGGIFTAVTETTSRVLGERRLKTLRALAAATAIARSPAEAGARAADALAENALDLPYALVYLQGASGHAATVGAHATAELVGCAGLVSRDALLPELAGPVPLEAGDGCAASRIAHVLATGEPELVTDAAGELGLAAGQLEHPAQVALIAPIAQAGTPQPAGVLVAGISPQRELDDDYRGFIALVAGQIATAVASAQAYEEERRRAEALAELDRAKTAFFSNVSHEFRTPLTLLLGPLDDALADTADPLSPRQRERQQLARRNALRLLKLVNTLLDFSRIEAGRANAVYEPIDLAAYTADLASAFRSVIEHAGLHYDVDCQRLSGPVYVDREMWEKIVFNLLSNAFKFTLGGEIALSLRPAGDAVELTVRDTGVGIPADEMPRLFERFHRVQNAEARTHEGSGIGLALVQELVRMHGGAISAASVPGGGTTFAVTIPMGREHLPHEQVRTERALATTALGAAPYVEEARRWLGGEASVAVASAEIVAPAPLGQQTVPPAAKLDAPARILVADDNADMRDYLGRLLGAHEYVVEAVRDGLAALEAARQRPPDLLLCDVMMPRLDGFGLIQAWRADPLLRMVPVMLLSARAGEEATVEGLAAGADDYLVKPFSASELLARVATRLEVARAEREAEARASELEAIFEAIADAVFVYDRSGRIVRSNSAGRALFGLDARDDVSSLSPEERRALVSAEDDEGRPVRGDGSGLARLLSGEVLTGPNAINVRLRVAGRPPVDVNITGAPLTEETGAVSGAIIIARDVTEQLALERRTREALAALLEMAEALTVLPEGELGEDASDGYRAIRQVMVLTQRVLAAHYVSAGIIHRDTGKIVPLAVAGLTKELERQWWQDLSSKVIGEYFSQDWIDRLYAGEAAVFDFAQQPPVPGQDYWGLTNTLAVPVRLDAQRLLLMGIEGGSRQIFSSQERNLAHAAAQLAALVLERGRLLREREEARASALALAEANRRMDQFMGIASHELKTPVTTIKANLDLMERRLTRASIGRETASREDLYGVIEAAKTLASRADRGMVRLVRLVDDLVDVSRIRAGRLDMRLDPCDLCAIVADSVESEREAHASRDIRLRMPDNEPIIVTADADRIGQVVTNYLTNALKYSKADAPVEVMLTRDAAVAHLAVRDFGPGLPPEERERVWEMFHRAPDVQVLTGSGVGLGLGLHICKTIVERHGGQVGVESEPGAGSTFWFTLPLQDAAGE
jgi:signal transduction histidine kinase/CheY-like chemotaxis protein